MAQRGAARMGVSYLWKPPICAAAYLLSLAPSGRLVAALGAKLPALPPGTTPGRLGAAAFLGALIVALAIGPVARRVHGRFAARWLILAAFVYVCAGLNNAIEATIFTTMGGVGPALITLLPCIALAGVAALLFRPGEKGEPFLANAKAHLAARPAQAWGLRLAAAWLAFPAIYFIFGMTIAPYVLEYYRQNVGGLTLPTMPVIAAVQLLRSALFLAAALPVIGTWSRSRRELFWWLGLALLALVGLQGLIQGYWLPLSMRAIHTAEITADSFAHAGALAALLGRPRPAVARKA